ncbi:MAG: asparagine synthase (glutamine-hydrolyzing) [Magnetococcus sp. DMHC-6]
MCGIVGFLDLSQQSGSASLQANVAKMADTLCHRGPDDEGIWSDARHGIALGHRRLAILELSIHGRQPMLSADGTWILVFNGEIYNWQELRQELTESAHAPHWRGRSDTETLLAALVAWGIEATLKKCIGMFAFALWDSAQATLFLARDRLGEKPLYYGWQQNVFLFGSELKALRVHPAWLGGMDPQALALYLRHNYIPAPWTIHPKIFKLLPGSWLSITPERQGMDDLLPTPHRYWSLPDQILLAGQNRLPADATLLTDLLERQIRASIRGQMVADVPVGCFLSGGIDSSLITALMQSESSRPIHTFTIGFEQSLYNEANEARAVAHHLGTHHSELIVTDQELLGVIPQLAEIYDEPFADSSQIPTYLLCQMARQQVTVALSGDGGDELFGGYTRYGRTEALWRLVGWLPTGLRRQLGKFLAGIPEVMWDRLLWPLTPCLPAQLRRHPGVIPHKIGHFLAAWNQDDFYRRQISQWSHPEQLILAHSGANCSYPFTESTLYLDGESYLHRMMALDSQTYLPDDILVKVDRAAMAVSLETRVPLLDHRVVELAWRIPASFKWHHGRGKWILRQVLQRHLPVELVERPKMGFGVPMSSWLRNPLRPWAEDLLSETRLRDQGILDPTPIRREWEAHIHGPRDRQFQLWPILMFQAWLEQNHK